MAVRLISPYLTDENLPWLAGNLHTHTRWSDGAEEAQAVVDRYAALGHGFLMISDHDCFPDLSTLDPRGMALIPGNEVSAGGPDVLHVGAAHRVEPGLDRQGVFDIIGQDGGFAVVNHPNWGVDFNHCPQEYLEQWQGYVGIEIYNAVICRLPGSPLATDRWDRLLSAGRRVWGFANDDSHRSEDVGLAWNVVQCRERTARALVEAMRHGRFYASTGVTIRRVRAEGAQLVVETDNAQRLAVYCDGQVRVHQADAREIAFTVPEAARWRYIRVECWGAGEAMAWTQPFFLER